MSVTRIAAAIQPSTWMRTGDSVCSQLQEKTPRVSNFAKAGVETLLVTLNPMALVAFVLAAWRMGQDLDWAGNFFIPQGLFSHWQVWFAAGITLKGVEILLTRAQAAQQQRQAAPATVSEQRTGVVSRAA